MSCKAKSMASIKASVEVSLQDFFDSIPNFIKSGPARSLKKKHKQIPLASVTLRMSRENRENMNHHSQFIPYPSGYTVPNPVPLNWYPALSPLVLSFHVWLLWNNSSENRSAVSPSSGFMRSRSPIRWRSIPLPVAASRVSRVCVCMALFNNSNLRFDCFAEMVSHMSCVTYDSAGRSRGGDKRRQGGGKNNMTSVKW